MEQPTSEEIAEGSVLVKALSSVLERLIKSNITIARSDFGQVTKFHALQAPSIGVEEYLERVHKYASCSNTCLTLALIYIDRLIERSNFLLTELTVHRVVITAVLLAAKFMDDAYHDNAYYAEIGGIPLKELNGLEVDFLFRINFSLRTNPEVFDQYRAELVTHAIKSGLVVNSDVSEPALSDITAMQFGSNTTATQHQMHQTQQFTPAPLHNLGNHTVGYDSMIAITQQVTPPVPSTFSNERAVNDSSNIVFDSIPMSQEDPSVLPGSSLEAPPSQDQVPFTCITPADKYSNFHPSLQSQITFKADSLSQNVSAIASCEINPATSRSKLTHSIPEPVMTVDQEYLEYMMNEILFSATENNNTLICYNHNNAIVAGESAPALTVDIKNHQSLNSATVAALTSHGNHHIAELGCHPGIQLAGL